MRLRQDCNQLEHDSTCATSGNKAVTILTQLEEEIELSFCSPSIEPEFESTSRQNSNSSFVIMESSTNNTEKINNSSNVAQSSKVSGILGNRFIASRKLSDASDRTNKSDRTNISNKSSSKRTGGVGSMRLGKTIAGHFRAKSKKKSIPSKIVRSSSNSSLHHLTEEESHVNSSNISELDTSHGSTLDSSMDTSRSHTPNSNHLSQHQQQHSNLHRSQTLNNSKQGLAGIPETNTVLQQSTPQTPLHSSTIISSDDTMSNNLNQNVKQSQFPEKWPKQQYSQQMQEWHDRELMNREVEQAGRRRQVRERDGFCRKVDNYDGQTITVDGKTAYELGNYLGDGVAGVVYEGTRLLPVENYPVRTGPIHVSAQDELMKRKVRKKSLIMPGLDSSDAFSQEKTSTLMLPKLEYESDPQTPSSTYKSPSQNSIIDLDLQLSPSIDMEETVAVKILNPVGFRLLSSTDANDAIVVQEGDPLSEEIKNGLSPMTERHVWWLINPNSRNLRTLLREPIPPSKNKQMGQEINNAVPYLETKDVTVMGTNNSDREIRNQNPTSLNRNAALSRGDYVDRGSANRGLKLSLLAAYKDPKTGSLRELPLTKCIEIWGHAPFGATEEEFEEMMDAIERVNEGKEPPVQNQFYGAMNAASTPSKIRYSSSGSTAPTRVMTADSSAWSEDLSSWSPHPSNGMKQPMHSKRSSS